MILHKSRNFTVTEILPNIFHFEFKSYRTMVRYFLRPQEYWESPVFKNKPFTHEEYKTWYSRTHDGKYDVEQTWAGCAMSETAFKPFFDGKFKKLRKEERTMLKILRPYKDKKYFVITSVVGDEDTLMHEIAHALYGTNLSYRKKVKKILNTLSNNTSKFLHSELHAMEYDYERYSDELHAYLLEGIKTMMTFTTLPKMYTRRTLAECNKATKKLRENYRATIPNETSVKVR